MKITQQTNMLHFLHKVFGITCKNPPEELGEVEIQDDSNVKFTWDKSDTTFTTGSDNVFRDIGCENPEELLKQAEARYGFNKILTKSRPLKDITQESFYMPSEQLDTKYANEYLSEAAINNMDLFNEIHLQERLERKDYERLEKLFKTSSILELPKITLVHLSKRQLTGILSTTEEALKETKDKFEKADLKFTIKAIKAILKGKVKNDK